MLLIDRDDPEKEQKLDKFKEVVDSKKDPYDCQFVMLNGNFKSSPFSISNDYKEWQLKEVEEGRLKGRKIYKKE